MLTFRVSSSSLTAKAHPKAKVAKPPTPVSHSSGEHFDENAELEKLNARLNGS